MNRLSLKLHSATVGKKVTVEVDAGRLERLAANLGFYSADFLKSIARAEQDARAGRVRKISSLAQLRAK